MKSVIEAKIPLKMGGKNHRRQVYPKNQGLL